MRGLGSAAIISLGEIAALFVGCSDKPAPGVKLADGVVYPVTYACTKGDDCAITIGTSPAIALPWPRCAATELAEEPAGKAVAYRCGSDGSWSVVRLRGGDRYIDDRTTRTGNGPKPDWSSLRPVAPDAMAYLASSRGDARQWAELARTIAEENGQDAAARFVVASTLHPADDFGIVANKYRDGWIDAYDTLSADGQAKVRAETCASLWNGGTSPLQYVRAARRCPLDEPHIAPIALADFKNGLAAPRPDFVGTATTTDASHAPDRLNPTELALVMQAWIALKEKPKEAAAAACEEIPKLSRVDDPIRVALAASVLSITKTRCPAVDVFSQLWPCGLESPQKSRISDAVAKVVPPNPSVPPVLPAANDAMFDALTIEGQYPTDYLDRQHADAGTRGVPDYSMKRAPRNDR